MLGFNRTVTVFNRVVRTDAQTGKTFSDRQATVIANCFYGAAAARIFADKAEIESNPTVCKIPTDARYLPPHEFEALPEAQQSEYFTLRPDDMIFAGQTQTPDEQLFHGSYFIIARTADLTSSGVLPHYRAEGGAK